MRKVVSCILEDGGGLLVGWRVGEITVKVVSSLLFFPAVRVLCELFVEVDPAGRWLLCG